jgi:type IV secretory pathway TrbF-like protein
MPVKQSQNTCPTPSYVAADLEEFVVGQIRQVARDPELVTQVLEEAKRQQKAELARCRSERDRLIK